MIKLILFSFLTLFTNPEHNTKNTNASIQQTSNQTNELDAYWKELSRTVREGDFEGYRDTYHDDAVVVFAVGENKSSVSIASALAGWKQGFIDTKSGKIKSDVEFRFSQRIGNENTAHDIGIFNYTSKGSDSDVNIFIHFEMLLVKKNGKWLGLMEYQKSNATKEEWESLK